jgi:thiol-disulfide isomerase/thioredoxin
MIAAAFLAAAAAAAAPRPVVAVTPERYLADAVAPHRGRPLVVNFWATWCEPCREELPSLARAWRKGKGAFDVVLVSADSLRLKDTVVPAVLDGIASPFRCFIESSEDPQTFIDAVDPRWEGELPHTIVYGRDGRPAASAAGRRTTEQFLKLIESAR